MNRGLRVAVVGALAAAATALAATPALGANSIASVDFGLPKAEIATTVKVRTIADVADEELYIRTRPAGGPPCAPTYASDPGTFLFSNESVPSGDTTTSRVETFSTPGTFQYCAWFQSDSSTVLATLSGTFTVASPVGAFTGVQAPTPAPPGRQFAITIQGNSEVQRYLFVAWRRASEPACGTAPSLDAVSNLPESRSPSDEARVLGNFSVPVTATFNLPGRYRICSWIAARFSDLSPIGVNETLITVASLKPKLATTVSGRRLVSRVTLGAPGRLRLVLSGHGRKVVLTARRVLSARTISISYRRPAGLPAGSYTLRATFTPDSTARALVATKRVRLG